LDTNPLLQAALAARKNAYTPYSRFPVGAAILTRGGRVFAGANVDNAAFPETACAEANALGAMVTAGEYEVAAVLVVGGPDDAPGLCTPCGGCRQRLAEFSGPETIVLLADPHGVRETVPLFELLPKAFGPKSLEARADV
jgi:cytidine deaminase